MRKIQTLAILIIMLVMTAMANDVWAAKKRVRTPAPEPEQLTEQKVKDDFKNYLENKQELRSLDNRIEDVQKYIDEILGLDAKAKADYLKENGTEIEALIKDCKAITDQYDEDKLNKIAMEFLRSYENNSNALDFYDNLRNPLNEKVNTLRKKLTALENEMNAEVDDGSIDWENLDWKLIGGILGGLMVLIIAIVIISKSRKKPTPGPVNVRNYSGNTGSGPVEGQMSADGNIIVRRKTATILKKQSLEDVIDNPNYMKVDAVDFTYDSSVRRMYIKNTCIIDIYNMYANDLRNPDSPKEDGCMVLGRWVHDTESNEYYVSLEEIVLPGDDAVFEEYALNFGGKIKLKVLEQLRKLRRETNLQYDLTCWVHSHPGLGVFFSNSDTSVQDQLKHPTHPNFLTAIVIDILTPMQDLGVFTFRRDATINSKNDLKKMYSLIEWYQWAKQSVETTPQRPVAAQARQFNENEYYNTLEHARRRDDSCYGVELSKNVIVDICMDLVGEGDDVMAMLHGFASQNGQKVEYVAEKVSDNDNEPKMSLTGCFIAAPHCSIPTVRKAVAEYLDRIRFVLVYTPSDGLLTTIPVIQGDLVVEEECHGEQKLDELKTWIKKGRQ